jgi:PhzF family phenazine biosynthesis protein
MNIRRIAAFSDGNQGGNPAGVWIGSSLPAESEMQRIASDVGFSETAFAAFDGESWRVRYFSPECEVPFCGHATIALGAVLAIENGDGVSKLRLNAFSMLAIHLLPGCLRRPRDWCSGGSFRRLFTRH